jgi:quercetin dioxygenase-like cupin family protein
MAIPFAQGATMTTLDGATAPLFPAVLTPGEQRAVRFLGALIKVRMGSAATGGRLAILEHQGLRGYSSPLHRHEADEETIFVLEGELRVEVDGIAAAAGPGAVAFLPHQFSQAFVVTSPQARFLTLHTPGGFDDFTVPGSVASAPCDAATANDPPPDPAALAKLAASYGVEILGPSPTP